MRITDIFKIKIEIKLYEIITDKYGLTLPKLFFFGNQADFKA